MVTVDIWHVSIIRLTSLLAMFSPALLPVFLGVCPQICCKDYILQHLYLQVYIRRHLAVHTYTWTVPERFTLLCHLWCYDVWFAIPLHILVMTIFSVVKFVICVLVAQLAGLWPCLNNTGRGLHLWTAILQVDLVVGYLPAHL